MRTGASWRATRSRVESSCMRRVLGGLALALLAAGCSSHSSATSTTTRTAPAQRQRASRSRGSGCPRWACRVSTPGRPGLRPDRRPQQQPGADRLAGEEDRLAETPPRGPDDAFFTPGYGSVITNEEFNDTLVELSLKSQRRVWTTATLASGVEPWLPQHARRRVPPEVGYHDRRRHPELPHCPAEQRPARRPRDRRQLRPRPAARLREPERGHAASGRRPSRHRDRRLDRPARAVREPPLVDPLSRRLPVRRAAAPGRPGARRELHHPGEDRDREPSRRGHLVVRRR